MFTKEHYLKIAEVLGRNKKLLYSGSEHALFTKMVQDFIELFKENPKFNEEKFLNVVYGKEVSK